MYLYCCSRLLGRNYQESAAQSDPLRLLCQTVTHRIPAKWYLNQSQSGILPIRDRIERRCAAPRQIRGPFSRYRSFIAENQALTACPSVHHSLLISNSLLPLYCLMFPIFRCTDNTRVIVARIQDSGDIFPDGSRHAIVKFVHCQFCQPVIDRRVKGFQLRRGKFITCAGNHFFQCLPG